MSKTQEMRDLSDDEIDARYLDERKNLFTLVNQKQEAGGKTFEKPHRIREARREIARLLTVKRERQLASQAE